ncbi:hypothetical protein C8R44DRAFT_861301 [Mycena epipterygia]|nr:hypothetical protein C8R44DRAFT_861301 [Mycena epipterygia]
MPPPQLQKGANDSRSDDLGRVTAAIGTWINQDRDRPDLAVFDHTPSIVDEEGNRVRQYAPLLDDVRLNRGVGHDVCGGLLSPLEHDWAVEGVRIKLRSGALALNESFYSRVFYLGFKGDPDDLDTGFLKSRYLVKAWRFSSYKIVFTGPSSAKDDVENGPPEKKSKTNKAIRKPVCEIMRMNGKVTPRSIAYIAITLHFALTNAQSWTPNYYGFSYPQMYNFIVDYFEAPGAGTPHRAHVDALLAWWNQQIFPTHASSASTNPTAASSMAKLRAQRRARVE